MEDTGVVISVGSPGLKIQNLEKGSMVHLVFIVKVEIHRVKDQRVGCV
jgi:hypothetical protein